ncbi:MAG: class I SAM-dependent methyltransferase [Lapillicoccus sp.]
MNDSAAGPVDQRAYWDAEAARFDEEADHGLRDPQTRAAWASLLRRHLPPPPADVLDLGCGTGTLTLLLAEAGHRVHGVDLAPAMVAAARAKLAGAGAMATVEEGDAADPPGDPGTFDVVLTRHVLWALPDPAAALRRWAGLLRPGGRLVLVEGRWWTGGGLTADETRRLVAPHARDIVVEPLTDPALWGGPVSDERYLLTATALPG